MYHLLVYLAVSKSLCGAKLIACVTPTWILPNDNCMILHNFRYWYCRFSMAYSALYISVFYDMHPVIGILSDSYSKQIFIKIYLKYQKLIIWYPLFDFTMSFFSIVFWTGLEYYFFTNIRPIYRCYVMFIAQNCWLDVDHCK